MVTAVALRLVPAVASRAVAWAGVDSPADALDLLRFLEARTNAVEGFELVPEDSLRAGAEAHSRARARRCQASIRGMSSSKRRPPTPAATSPPSSSAARRGARKGHDRRRGDRLERGPGRGLLEDPRFHLRGRARRRADARARHLGARSPTCRASSSRRRPRSSAPSRASSPAASATSATAISTSTSAPRSHAAPDWYEREGAEITRLVDDLVTAAGGSISAEHGIGQLKRDEFARLAPPGRIHALRRSSMRSTRSAS